MTRRRLVLLASALALAGLVAGALLAPRPGSEPTPPSAPGTFAADDPDLGRRAYVFCQGCHGPEGRGVPGYAPALAGSPWLAGDPRAAVLMVLHGYDARSEPGAPSYSAQMPAHAALLADHEVAALVTWARRRWGAGAGTVDAALVARLRQRHALRTAPWTPAELRALPAEH